MTTRKGTTPAFAPEHAQALLQELLTLRAELEVERETSRRLLGLVVRLVTKRAMAPRPKMLGIGSRA